MNGFQVAANLLHVLDRNGLTRLPGVCLRHLLEATPAIEEAHQLPGRGSKVEHGIHSRHVNPHRGPAIHNVFFEDNVRVQAWTALRNEARRNLRQSYIECSSEIHGRVSIRRVEFMPGRNGPGVPISSTMPSRVPLVGSTIGLSWTTLAWCSCPGK